MRRNALENLQRIQLYLFSPSGYIVTQMAHSNIFNEMFFYSDTSFIIIVIKSNLLTCIFFRLIKITASLLQNNM